MSGRNDKAIPSANVRVDVARLVSMKKAAEVAAAKRERTSAAGDWPGDEQFASKYPSVYAMLAASLVDLDCDPGATLNVWLSPNGWVCCFSPRWLGVKCFRSADTLEGLLESLEEFLNDEEPDWRSETGSRKAKPAKRPRTSKPR
jgi:hypothetical protein